MISLFPLFQKPEREFLMSKKKSIHKHLTKVIPAEVIDKKTPHSVRRIFFAA